MIRRGQWPQSLAATASLSVARTPSDYIIQIRQGSTDFRGGTVRNSTAGCFGRRRVNLRPLPSCNYLAVIDSSPRVPARALTIKKLTIAAPEPLRQILDPALLRDGRAEVLFLALWIGFRILWCHNRFGRLLPVATVSAM